MSIRTALRIAFAAALLLAQAAQAADTAGTLFIVVGDVSIVGPDGARRAAVRGAELKEGDKVVTGDSGLAQVSLTDGGRLSIRSGSELVLTQYKYNKDGEGAAAKADSGSGFVLSLLRGGFRSITGLIAKANPDSYKIQTPTATIGVRGTDHEPFFVPEPKVGEAPPIAPPGTYDKVNAGQTFLRTTQGLIDVKPGQVAFTPVKIDRPPVILPKAPDFYADPPTKGGRMLPLAGRPDKGDDGSAKGDVARKDADDSGNAKTTTLRTLDPATLGKTVTTSDDSNAKSALTTDPAISKEALTSTSVLKSTSATSSTELRSLSTPTLDPTLTKNVSTTPVMVDPTLSKSISTPVAVDPTPSKATTITTVPTTRTLTTTPILMK